MRLSSGLHKLNKDYGKGLAKLVKKETKSGSGEEGSSLTVSHKASLAHLTVLAARHKQIAVSLGNLSKEYDSHVTRLLEQHKTVELEGRRMAAAVVVWRGVRCVGPNCTTSPSASVRDVSTGNGQAAVRSSQ